ncbi:pilus assembly PilX family protein [Guyparkeria halophila]|nr:PilX N-terminal domain-containing pilus assembly protein [Guyparkeria halophila]
MTHNTHTQTGSALVIGLIILLVMTIIGVTTMQTTLLQEKMTGSLRDGDLAFQAAEAALREAEESIEPSTSQPGWVVQLNSPPNLLEQDHSWWTNNSNTEEATFSGVASNPRYVGESEAFIRDTLRLGHGPVTGRNVFRTTARGTGGTDSAEAIIRTRYAKRYN